MAKKPEQPAPKKENRFIAGIRKYLKEVRAELQKVVWPSRQTATNLTLIVLAVTTVMSISLGFIDWLFSQLFGWIVS